MKKDAFSGVLGFCFSYVGETPRMYVGCFPLTKAEMEKYLNQKNIKRSYPNTTEDAMFVFELNEEESDKITTNFAFGRRSNHLVIASNFGSRWKNSAFMEDFLWGKEQIRIFGNYGKGPFNLYIMHDNRLEGITPLAIPPVKGIYLVPDKEGVRVKIRMANAVIHEIYLKENAKNIEKMTLYSPRSEFLIIEAVDKIQRIYIYEIPRRMIEH